MGFCSMPRIMSNRRCQYLCTFPRHDIALLIACVLDEYELGVRVKSDRNAGIHFDAVAIRLSVSPPGAEFEPYFPALNFFDEHQTEIGLSSCHKDSPFKRPTFHTTDIWKDGKSGYPQRGNLQRQRIVLYVAVRRLEVHLRESDRYDIRCFDCDWIYRIGHRSPLVPELEETIAARAFTDHKCADFPRAKAQSN